VPGRAGAVRRSLGRGQEEKGRKKLLATESVSPAADESCTLRKEGGKKEKKKGPARLKTSRSSLRIVIKTKKKKKEKPVVA